MREFEEIIKSVAKTNSVHPWRDIVDCSYDQLNNRIRTQIEKKLNIPPTSRDEEIEDIITQERIKWESDKAEFESNPIHWSNNKRRRNGLQTLRGKTNKNRITKFYSFKPTPRVFFAIEDMLDELLPKKLDEHFAQFVDVKDISVGDAATFYVSP